MVLVDKSKRHQRFSKKNNQQKFKPHLIKNMNDEEAIIYLSNLRQIGRWSAEMILLLLLIDQTFGLYKI